MSAENFEKQLQQQRFRSIPPAWREQVLKSAQAAGLAQPSTAQLQPLPLAWWRELLWPSPHAWAGLAALWIIILGLHSFSWGSNTTSSSAPVTAGAPAPEVRAMLAEQRRLLAELLTDADSLQLPMPPDPAERPRSQIFWPSKHSFAA